MPPHPIKILLMPSVWYVIIFLHTTHMGKMKEYTSKVSN